MKRALTLLAACLLVLAAGQAAVAASGGPADGVSSQSVTSAEPGANAFAGPTDTSTLAVDEDRGSIRIVEFDYSPEEPITGEPATFTVTVENDGEVPVTFDAARVVNNTRPYQYVDRPVFGETTDWGVLQPGERRTVDFEATFEQVGEKRVFLNASGTTRIDGADDNHTVRDMRRLKLDIREPPEADPLVSIRGETLYTNGSGTAVVEVTNVGEATMKNVEVRFAGAVDVKDGRQIVREIEPNETETLEFDVSSDQPGKKKVRVALKYDLPNGGSGQASASTQLLYEDPETATIEIHKFDTEQKGDGLVYIEGSVSNVGQADASVVTVSVVDSEHVTPSPRQRSWPVGELLPDDAPRTFELYANVDGNATEIPLRITYTSNDVEQSVVVREPYEPPSSDSSDEAGGGGGGGGGGPVKTIGLLVTVVIGGLIVYAWRNSSGDDDGGEAPVSGGTGGGVDALVDPDADGGNAGDAGDAAAETVPTTQGHGMAPPQGPQAGRGTPQGGTGHGTPRQAAGQGAGPQGANAQNTPTAHGRGTAPPQEPQAGAAGGGTPQQAGVPQHSTDGGTQAGGQPTAQAGGHQPAGAGGQPNDPATRGGTAAARCDACGEPHAPDDLGSIALGGGNSVAACTDCKRRALETAKRHLGADEEGGADGVDELVAAMSDHPACDGCGDPTPAEDLDETSLPDGSSAVACSSCRETAIAAAKRELTGN